MEYILLFILIVIAVVSYTDKREVARVLNKAVRDGENPEIVSNHLFMAQSAARNNPQPVINRGFGLYINWRRLLRF